jgi:mono/diheme cytochrome c family protein
MSRVIVNSILLAVLLGTFVVAAAMRRDPSSPNFSFMREMVDSVPFDSYAPNPALPNGRTLQPPIPGTIARGDMPLHFTATPEDALRAGEELRNPFGDSLFWGEPDAEALARVDAGAEAYRIYCLPCHGATGTGDGPVVMRGFPPPPPPSPERILSDGQMFHIITFGQGNMPSYASQVSPEDRWRIILYMRSMQQAADAAAGGHPE